MNYHSEYGIIACLIWIKFFLFFTFWFLFFQTFAVAMSWDGYHTHSVYKVYSTPLHTIILMSIYCRSQFRIFLWGSSTPYRNTLFYGKIEWSIGDYTGLGDCFGNSQWLFYNRTLTKWTGLGRAFPGIRSWYLWTILLVSIPYQIGFSLNRFPTSFRVAMSSSGKDPSGNGPTFINKLAPILSIWYKISITSSAFLCLPLTELL